MAVVAVRCCYVGAMLRLCGDNVGGTSDKGRGCGRQCREEVFKAHCSEQYPQFRSLRIFAAIGVRVAGVHLCVYVTQDFHCNSWIPFVKLIYSLSLECLSVCGLVVSIALTHRAEVHGRGQGRSPVR